jgi:hypothetical protein
MTNRPFQGPPTYDLLRSPRATETNRINAGIEADWPTQWREAHSELSILRRAAALRKLQAEYLRASAFHEAAHVVIWKELTGLDIVHVSIVPEFTDGTVGLVKLTVCDPLGLEIAIHWENSGVRRGDLFRKAMRAAALFALAGLEAENAFFYSRPCHIDPASFFQKTQISELPSPPNEGRATGYNLSPSRSNAFCWIGVGRVRTVSV